MRILFIGTVKSSKILLEKLIAMNENIVGVITKKNSNFNSDFYDLSIICNMYNIDYKYADNINDIDIIEYIKEKKTDVIYCFGWSQLLKREIIDLARLGTIGFHPAKLPQNRGRHPIIWALALGMKETASTFFFMNEGADTGEIILQQVLEIYYEDDANTLYNRIMSIAKTQVEKLTIGLKTKSFDRSKQNNRKSNFWRKRGKEDGKIDWRMSSRSIYNLTRALTKPYVGAHFVFNDKDIKVWKVKEVVVDGYENIEPGKVLDVDSDKSFLIKTGDNLIKVLNCDSVKLRVGDYL